MLLEDRPDRPFVAPILLRHLREVEVLRLSHRLIGGVQTLDLVAQGGMGGRVLLDPSFDSFTPNACFAVEHGIRRHGATGEGAFRGRENPGLKPCRTRRAGQDDELVGRFVSDLGDGRKAAPREDLPGLRDRRFLLALVVGGEDTWRRCGMRAAKVGSLGGDAARSEARRKGTVTTLSA
jgi:hypothetical protein